MRPQGSFANYTGNQLQTFIFNKLVSKGYTQVAKKQFDTAKILDQPIFCPQFPICKGIYNTQLNCDFILFHPQKHPNCLVIESKWQESAGSVDEKFPYLVANIKECYPYVSMIVIDGGGYKKQAEEWLRKQVDKKLVAVMNMGEFQKWSNSEAL